jgi:predicted RNA-binding protein with PUA domain
MTNQSERLDLIDTVSERLIDEYGSALKDVGEEAVYLLRAIASYNKTEVDIDGELFNFLSSEFDRDEPVWDYVKVVED